MYTLGLDLSTQSLSATLLQRNGGEIQCCGSWSVAFRELAPKYQLDRQTLCLPQNVLFGSLDTVGFYAQAPQMFLDSLDLLLARMQVAGASLQEVAAVNCAAQQHGQVWLNENFERGCEQLHTSVSCLSELFAASYAYPAAPIWMCSQTKTEAQHLRRSLGAERVLELSGSAAPLRFSGLVLRWLSRHDGAAYQQCRRIHLLSSWLAAVLSGNSAAPIDWGNGTGTALMDYRGKVWSDELLSCLGEGLPGGVWGLRAKLPELASPLQLFGTLAPYFGKYGFSADCRVLIGSGDNPQVKVVCEQGDLLSLGSSFVLMSRSNKLHEWANAMYDGLGRPFSFVCRTNGALVWDALRKHLRLSFAEQDRVLAEHPLGSVEPRTLRLMNESFPPGMATHEGVEDFCQDYYGLVAVIDGTLHELHGAYQEIFGPEWHGERLYVTGGLSQSVQIRKRIEQIWRCPVATLGVTAASYGAALAALIALE